MNKSFLFFSIGNQKFAIETENIVSVEDSSKIIKNIVPLPYSPVFVKGVARVREMIVQVLDMGCLLFNFETLESKASVILSHDNKNTMFLISDMDNVSLIQTNEIKIMDNFSYILKNNEVVTILDMNTLFKKVKEQYCQEVG